MPAKNANAPNLPLLLDGKLTNSKYMKKNTSEIARITIPKTGVVSSTPL